ncbi:LysR family substrate-binding domain-containing protein [Microbacterium sp. No. 7]|uniref:LysR family substrate-binding domain-containing protein n=1 Tax=Microbacterium sp. No. 7 TaxID=1714373 RepID=UPI0006D0F22F|nr:LysR family substrate-binding domain-containing protein [Microbacterium sp. No. 7]ALJ21664.1 transcriptional regulator [Microbacterium sp. No. 7]
MAGGGGSQRRRPGAPRQRPGGSRTARPRDARPPRTNPADAPPPGAEPAGPFRLGAIPGATPGKWISTWNERMPRTPLELVPLAVAGQRDAVLSASVDAAIVRLPLDRDGLHVIALYDEVPVVVCAADSHLTAADELTLDDLAGEIVLTPADDVLHLEVPGAVAPAFDPPATTEDAIATVAAGVGAVIVPMSLARLHHRRDVAFRPLADAPLSSVALAWPAEAATPLVDVFVGIVRGRTANSSRG